MQAETIIYGAVVLSVSVWLGTLAAFFWSERRWRKREQWLASLSARPLDAPDIPRWPADDAEPPTIPITRRPFHEALWEDEPDLAPSPRLRAFLQRSGFCSDRPEAPGQIHRATEGNRPPPETGEASIHEENDEMLKQKIAAAALAAGALTACQSKPPEVRRNAHPQERYEITMTIQDAPGPLTDVGGFVQYNVDNWQDCMPEKFSFELGAHREKPEEFLPLRFDRIAENVYRTEVGTDALRDEDYHGLGVCRWKLMVVKPSLKGKTVLFMPRITLDELRAKQPKTLYFSQRTYWSTELEDFPDSGDASPSEFGKDVQDELFTITLTPRRIAP